MMIRLLKAILCLLKHLSNYYASLNILFLENFPLLLVTYDGLYSDKSKISGPSSVCLEYAVCTVLFLFLLPFSFRTSSVLCFARFGRKANGC